MAPTLKLSPWQNMATHKPARKGIYRVQDFTMSCECCWIDARWNGREWSTRGWEKHFNHFLPIAYVTRWRGRL